MIEMPRETQENLPVSLLNGQVEYLGAVEVAVGKVYERPVGGWTPTTVVDGQRVFLFDGPAIHTAHGTGKVKVWVRLTGLAGGEAPVIEAGEIKVT